MAEAIEKERGRGGGEAMLRVANLEEQLRQVQSFDLISNVWVPLTVRRVNLN
jgi:hypothetical protein